MAIPRKATPDPGNAGTGRGGPASPASGVSPASVSPASVAPASVAGASHVTVTVLVLAAALHADPAGTGPSAATSVSGTGPATEHVKFVFGVFALENDPFGADQA
jgi:hypothetical protein